MFHPRPILCLLAFLAAGCAAVVAVGQPPVVNVYPPVQVYHHTPHGYIVVPQLVPVQITGMSTQQINYPTPLRSFLFGHSRTQIYYAPMAPPAATSPAPAANGAPQYQLR